MFVCVSYHLVFYYSLNFLDKRLQARMPSSQDENWQPLFLYRNSLLHGKIGKVSVTRKQAYTRRKKDQLAGKGFLSAIFKSILDM